VARAWYMSRLWVPNFVLAASLVRARFERADWATMGNHIPATGVLAELDAFFAAFLAASAALTMLRPDALPVRAIVMIVVHVPVLRRVLRRIGMVRRPLSHS
jgi:hypothetical protein